MTSGMRPAAVGRPPAAPPFRPLDTSPSGTGSAGWSLCRVCIEELAGGFGAEGQLGAAGPLVPHARAIGGDLPLPDDPALRASAGAALALAIGGNDSLDFLVPDGVAYELRRRRVVPQLVDRVLAAIRVQLGEDGRAALAATFRDAPVRSDRPVMADVTSRWAGPPPEATDGAVLLRLADVDKIPEQVIVEMLAPTVTSADRSLLLATVPVDVALTSWPSTWSVPAGTRRASRSSISAISTYRSTRRRSKRLCSSTTRAAAPTPTSATRYVPQRRSPVGSRSGGRGP